MKQILFLFHVICFMFHDIDNQDKIIYSIKVDEK